MHYYKGARGIVALSAGLTLVACGSKPAPQLPVAPPAAGSTVSVPSDLPSVALTDPIADLIARSTAYFDLGQRELEQGHLASARTEFDRAVDVILESALDLRSDRRLSDHFDRIVDKITAVEINAFATGDGFTELTTEPAPIDELLSEAMSASLDPAPDLEETVRADLGSTPHDVPIPLNDRVLSYVKLFQGRLRDWFTSALTRGTQYLPMIQEVFKAEGIPLDLALVPLVESAFKPTALSRASAKGVWQFMKGTATEQGLKQDWYVDERADPEKATVAAARYLKILHSMFDGDWHLALASYNGGPGRVQRATQRSGRYDYWQLSESSRFLPRETREYVPMILAAIIVARNPDQYGFDIEEQSPLAYDKVVVSRAVDLRKVAEWTGAAVQDILALNPELRRLTTPVKADNYEVKLPVGTGDTFLERLSAAQPGEVATLNWHVVKRGETFATIARKYGVRSTDVAEANRLARKTTLRVGQELIIPHGPALAGGPGAAVATTQMASSKRAASKSKLVYRVKGGDTLGAIARTYDTTVALLKSWNNLRTDRLKVGDRLTIFTSAQ